jgi:hypothetical protein
MGTAWARHAMCELALNEFRYTALWNQTVSPSNISPYFTRNSISVFKGNKLDLNFES